MVDLLTFLLTIANVHDSSRFVVGVLFSLFVSGWSIVGWLRLDNPALEFSLSVGTSLSVLMVSAQIMITIHAWHLAGFEAILSLACLPSLIWLARGPGESTHSE